MNEFDQHPKQRRALALGSGIAVAGCVLLLAALIIFGFFVVNRHVHHHHAKPTPVHTKHHPKHGVHKKRKTSSSGARGVAPNRRTVGHRPSPNVARPPRQRRRGLPAPRRPAKPHKRRPPSSPGQSPPSSPPPSPPHQPSTVEVQTHLPGPLPNPQVCLNHTAAVNC